MKNFFILFFVFFTFNGLLFAQKTIWTDTICKIDDELSDNPIFFELAKADLLENAYPYLDNIAKILLENQKLMIEIVGHEAGYLSKQYSSRVFFNRAQAMGDYLLQKGVPSEQIRVFGFNKDSDRHDGFILLRIK